MAEIIGWIMVGILAVVALVAILIVCGIDWGK